MEDRVKVVVTGAAGQIGYSLIPRLIDGHTFKNKIVDLELVEIPQVVDKLKGLVMELEDSNFPNMGDVNFSSDFETAAKNADWFLLVGSIPRGIVHNGKKIEERSDLLQINGGIFLEQGKAIGQYGKSNAKILVVGNPANTNALIARENAPSLDPKNFTAMTRLDHNRAKAQLAEKSGVHVSQIKGMIIWGNHSATQYPDISHTTVSGAPAKTTVPVDWYRQEFIPNVQQRGTAIIKARGASSAASAASAAIDHVRDWALGNPGDDWVSMAVASDGSYGIAEGVVYSYPVRCQGDGGYEIVQNLSVDDFSRDRMDATDAELREERENIEDLL